MANLPLPPIQRFIQRLTQLGYVEGNNIIIEYRFGEGRDDRFPAFAAELVALPVEVIVVWGNPAAFAAKRATTTIPILSYNRGIRCQKQQGRGECARRSESVSS
jgi:hypothetical protein